MHSPARTQGVVPPETIAFTFWGQPSESRRLCNGEPSTNIFHGAYMRYYYLQRSYFAHLEQDSCFHDFTSQAEVVQMLKDDFTRERAASLLKSRHVNSLRCCQADTMREDLLKLAARLLSMTSIGSLQNEVNPRRYVDWDYDSTLRNCLSAHFDRPHEMQWERTRLPRSFDAWSLSAVAGITIKFTDNLADHLLLVEDDTLLLVFHHASFLEHQTDESVLPPGVAHETLKTFAILFPQSDYTPSRRGKRYKKQWFSKIRQNYEQECGGVLDRRLIKCGTLDAKSRQIEQFRFWRDRLVILKEAFDDATPRTLSQWWYDRRNGVQWYTFWVAVLVLVLTILFGLVQCIEGGLQVYKAYHP